MAWAPGQQSETTAWEGSPDAARAHDGEVLEEGHNFSRVKAHATARLVCASPGEAMSGLFYNIKGFFKATHSGRYLAFILAELFYRDPHAFSRILKAARIGYTPSRGDRAVANGWLFPAMAQQRFADIAVVTAAGDPLVLVEIKDADIRSESNAAQINDYLEFIGKKKNQNVAFLFLSRALSKEEDEQTLQAAMATKRVYRMYFYQLHRPLRNSNVFGQMLKGYLEDINVTYYDRRPETRAINTVTDLMLGIGGRRKIAEKSVPEFFSITFGNLSSIGQWI